MLLTLGLWDWELSLDFLLKVGEENGLFKGGF